MPFDDFIRLPNSQCVRILVGDCVAILRALPEGQFQTCVTSPPYFGLRDYQVDGQIGMEATPAEYVSNLVEAFRQVRRVVRDDGTLWLNLGDSYANGGRSSRDVDAKLPKRAMRVRPRDGAKPKDLLGIPWRVAFALQADGWWLRSAIIWHKPNPVPESVKDRPTSAYEMIFLFAKSQQYYYDGDSIREPRVGENNCDDLILKAGGVGRNARNVWTIRPSQFRGAHFATMAPELVRRCILAGCPEGSAVLDPFGGAGTTGLIAGELNRRATLIELNAAYAVIARDRLGHLVAA